MSTVANVNWVLWDGEAVTLVSWIEREIRERLPKVLAMDRKSKTLCRAFLLGIGITDPRCLAITHFLGIEVRLAVDGEVSTDDTLVVRAA